MAQIGIMIEGQDGLNWERWTRLLQAAEDLGFAFVFRSDHFAFDNPPVKDSLELWVSLTYAAMHTRRIEFGPMVAPVTFRHPAMTARMGAQVDDLSGGRLSLGLGVGWHQGEHTMFGVPFYDRPTRFEMFADALEITRLLLESDQPVTFHGAHFSLENALLLPRPKRKTPVLIGGSGPNRTLPLVARYADEWNGVFIDPATYRARCTRLDELLVECGRPANAVKRSIMTLVEYARSEAELAARLHHTGLAPQEILSRGLIVGTASQVVDQIGAFVEAGAQRFMLQWLDQDDMDRLEHMAAHVLPQVT